MKNEETPTILKMQLELADYEILQLETEGADPERIAAIKAKSAKAHESFDRK